MVRSGGPGGCVGLFFVLLVCNTRGRLFDVFDEVFVITLPGGERDVRAKLANLGNISGHIVTGVDWQEVRFERNHSGTWIDTRPCVYEYLNTSEAPSGRSQFMENVTNVPRGGVAVKLSHERALESFLRTGGRTGLILEEDFAPRSDPQGLSRRLDAALEHLPRDWNLFYLGGCYSFCAEEVHLGGDVYTSVRTLCNHAYAVTREGASRLMQAHQRCDRLSAVANSSQPGLRPCDSDHVGALAVLSPEVGLRAYRLHPELITQQKPSISHHYGSILGSDAPTGVGKEALHNMPDLECHSVSKASRDGHVDRTLYTPDELERHAMQRLLTNTMVPNVTRSVWETMASPLVLNLVGLSLSRAPLKPLAPDHPVWHYLVPKLLRAAPDLPFAKSSPGWSRVTSVLVRCILSGVMPLPVSTSYGMVFRTGPKLPCCTSRPPPDTALYRGVVTTGSGSLLLNLGGGADSEVERHPCEGKAVIVVHDPIARWVEAAALLFGTMPNKLAYSNPSSESKLGRAALDTTYGDQFDSMNGIPLETAIYSLVYDTLCHQAGDLSPDFHPRFLGQAQQLFARVDTLEAGYCVVRRRSKKKRSHLEERIGNFLQNRSALIRSLCFTYVLDYLLFNFSVPRLCSFLTEKGVS
mmetsp:Transcript_9757/g.27413  ORF Transcript_9757/g.27413 Transcript_9757/m.27413 type:complete len:638 (+) Transcript_9757:208-2121(+)